MPKVSVIVPIYNVAAYIERCARSLMEQTLTDIEYIFVNDCTQDNSIEILKRTIEHYPRRKGNVKYVNHDVNKGLTSARNSGLKLATGDYIAHCDSDDWVEPTMYEELYNKAIEANADVVYSDINMVFRDGCSIYRAAEYSSCKKTFMRNYIASVWTCLVNIFAKRELYEVHNLSSPTHLCYCEDFWLSVRLLHYAGEISHIEKAFYNYNRTNETSIVHRLNNKTEKDEQVAYLETIDFFIEQGYLRDYEKEMSWRILKSKQELVLDAKRHSEFVGMFPMSQRFIWSCPFINVKLKLMMWLLTHHCRLILLFILKLRSFIRES